jgi:1-acyl-sn-glycerol-3-phosphate acyltransferase
MIAPTPATPYTRPASDPPSPVSAPTSLRYLLGAWFVVVFLSLGALGWLCMFWPNEPARRRIIQKLARAIFALGGCRIDWRDAPRLPRGPCIVIANHQSYLDGPLLRALLPPPFNFVIKNSMRHAPLAGFLLRRIGSEFVERSDRHKGAVDAKRFFHKASQGGAWVVFPEGTFDTRIGVLPFLEGAFGAARHAQLPVVCLSIQGTRAVLPGERLWPCPHRLRVKLLNIYPAPTSREEIKRLAALTRAEIAHDIAEPLIERS